MAPKQKRDGNAVLYSAKTAKCAKKKNQKEKSACQNYLTHDSQIILDCRGPKRGEGEDEEEKCKIEK